jgi:hypothetical protein
MALIKLRRGASTNIAAARGAVGEPMLAEDSLQLFIGQGDAAAPVEMQVSKEKVIGLLTNGKIAESLLPRIAITETFVVADEAAQLALDVQEGDIAVRTDIRKNYVRNGVAAVGGETVADLWIELMSADFAADFDQEFSQKDTDDLAEGSVNLYYTNARARAAVSAAGDLVYDQATGEFSVTTYKSADFDADLATKSTTDLAEGTRLYFTDARAQASAETKITALRNVVDGIAGLDSNGKIEVSALPTQVVSAGDDANRLAFGGTNGQFAKSDGAGNLSFDDSVDGGSF